MKKIDLHVHTVKTISDNSNRDIEPKKFVEIMNLSDVGIVSITNHNIFNIDQYNKIKEINDKNKDNFLLLPGIELDVYLNDKKNRKQLNVILDDSDKSSILNFIKNKSISYDNPIHINEVIDYFDRFKCLFYIDSKNNKGTSFKNNDINFLNMIKNNPVIHDVSSLDKFSLIIKNNENSLIGSDNLDWDSYLENSNKLIKYNSYINTFDDLWHIFKNHENFEIFKKFNLVKEFDQINDDNLVLPSSLYILKESVNIIFGPKASGKTHLLNLLFKNLKHIDNSKKYLWTPIDWNEKNDKNKEKNISNLIGENFNTNNDEFDDIKKLIINTLKEIKQYNEINIDQKNFFKFVRYHKQNEIKQKNILNVKLEQISKNEINNKKLIEICVNLKSSIYNAKTYESIDNEWKKENDIEKIKNIIENVKNEFIKINKNYWKFIILSKIIEKWSRLYEVDKNIYNKVNSFGMKDIFNKRRNLFKNVQELKTMIKNANKEIVIKTFDIPIDSKTYENNHWKLVKQLIFKWHNKGKKTDSLNTLNKLLDWPKNINKLSNPNSIVQKPFWDEEPKNIFDFKYKFINDININKNPSTGEYYYIYLIWCLENNYDRDYIFLDEPETHLSNPLISNKILKIIKEYKKLKKTIIMVTHNNILGLNTRPTNFIFRNIDQIDFENRKNNNTYIGNLSTNILKSIFYEEINLPLNKMIFKYFEGDENMYKIRNRIYDIKE